MALMMSCATLVSFNLAWSPSCTNVMSLVICPLSCRFRTYSAISLPWSHSSAMPKKRSPVSCTVMPWNKTKFGWRMCLYTLASMMKDLNFASNSSVVVVSGTREILSAISVEPRRLHRCTVPKVPGGNGSPLTSMLFQGKSQCSATPFSTRSSMCPSWRSLMPVSAMLPSNSLAPPFDSAFFATRFLHTSATTMPTPRKRTTPVAAPPAATTGKSSSASAAGTAATAVVDSGAEVVDKTTS
mmetsp:Transcript_80002/g.224552  ORF Transcript_80002/g.224552 Transcript_80002/m.224552 type:complete len:241 (-) Transcript_80002:788-1510(-)